MEISTARVEPHERATSEDFEYGFQSILRNTAVLDRMLTTQNIDYLVGGMVRAVPGTLTFTVDPLWANGLSIDLPGYQPIVSDPISINAPTSYPRYSIVQVRGFLESFDNQRRSFYNPELDITEFSNIDTKNRLVADIVVKHNNEGVMYAPETDTGYVKIAEIYLEPGDTQIEQEKIKNVTAVYQGVDNSAWTTEKTRTFRVGNMSDMWSVFDQEHTAEGHHRAAVIKAINILLGTDKDALKGSNISIGENINEGDLSLLAATTILQALQTIGLTMSGGTQNTLLKKLFMLQQWRDNEVYQPYMPTFFQGIIYYANPLNLPMKGESPNTVPAKWLNAAGDVTYLPPNDGKLYGMQDRMWTELLNDGNKIKALKFYSDSTFMLTNATTAYRRSQGGDIGLLYLTENHEVYHFDTDNYNQYQESNIVLDYIEEPVRKGAEDSYGDLSFEPILSDTVPFEMNGKSLYGKFSVSGYITAQNSTLEFWMRIFVAEKSVLIRLGTQTQDLVTLNIGGADPEYCTALPGDIPYSIADSIDEKPYSFAGTSGCVLYHDWGEGNESIDLDAVGVVLSQRTWIHIAFVLTTTTIIFYIDNHQFNIARHRPVSAPLPFVLNEELNEFNLDELSIIDGAMLSNSDFVTNTEKRIPYAALDYQQKHAVLMVDDPQKFHTNIFESPQFVQAVQAIIDNQ